MEGLSSFQSGFVLTATEFIGDWGAKVGNDAACFGGYNLPDNYFAGWFNSALDDWKRKN